MPHPDRASDARLGSADGEDFPVDDANDRLRGGNTTSERQWTGRVSLFITGQIPVEDAHCDPAIASIARGGS
jgi:hypothetical protein